MRRSQLDETRSRRLPGAWRRGSNFKRRFTARYLRRRRRELLVESRTPRLGSSDIVACVVVPLVAPSPELTVSRCLQAEEQSQPVHPEGRAP